MIGWIEEHLAEFRLTNPTQKPSKLDPHSNVTFVRYWIYSHHIYSNEKRRNMAAISDNLGLTGFILPGKPGIICVEGAADKVQQFYAQIKRYVRGR